LGIPHPRYLYRALSSADFAEWMAYDQIEPFGESRADLRAGIIAATTANVWRGDDVEPFEPSDFMPVFSAENEAADEPQTWQEQMILVEMLNTALGGHDLRTQ